MNKNINKSTVVSIRSGLLVLCSAYLEKMVFEKKIQVTIKHDPFNAM